MNFNRSLPLRIHTTRSKKKKAGMCLGASCGVTWSFELHKRVCPAPTVSLECECAQICKHFGLIKLVFMILTSCPWFYATRVLLIGDQIISSTPHGLTHIKREKADDEAILVGHTKLIDLTNSQWSNLKCKKLGESNVANSGPSRKTHSQISKGSTRLAGYQTEVSETTLAESNITQNEF